MLSRVTIAISLFIAFAAVGQQKDNDTRQKPKDPFDLSETERIAKDLGAPTTSEVAALETKAKQLFESGDCKEALGALDRYARKANWLANLIAAGLEPFYGASYDDRKDFNRARLSSLAPYEGKASLYRRERNHAMVMRAECLIKLGNKTEAVSVLVGALGLIEINDTVWWDRARKDLFDLLEIQ